MTLRGGTGDNEIHRVRRVSLLVGSGYIGATIGEGWRRAGHDVTHASRSPQPPGTIGIADAIALADLVLLAMPGAAVPALVAAHRDALNGRLVVNATSDVGAERLHRAERVRPVRPRARATRTRVQHARLRDVRRPNGGGEAGGTSSGAGPRTPASSS